MGFWETALAAFVGGLAVLCLAGLFRFGWLVFKMRFTAFGRLQTRAGTTIEKALRKRSKRAESGSSALLHCPGPASDGCLRDCPASTPPDHRKAHLRLVVDGRVNGSSGRRWAAASGSSPSSRTERPCASVGIAAEGSLPGVAAGDAQLAPRYPPPSARPAEACLQRRAGGPP